VLCQEPGKLIREMVKQAELIDTREQCGEFAVKIFYQSLILAARIVAEEFVFKLKLLVNKDQKLRQALDKKLKRSAADRFEMGSAGTGGL
jgi:hypothetical protein